MSSIFGLIRWDGAAAQDSTLEKMHEAAPELGLGGRVFFRDGAMGLGSGLSRTAQGKPDGPSDSLIESGPFVIAFDGRLDTPGSRGKPSRDEDARTILREFERSGPACLEKLIGDFAFAIWDRRQRSLFMARDAIGVRPIYYAQTKSLFAFATDVRALRALPEVPDRLDEVTLLTAFQPVLRFGYRCSTSFTAIKRLPAAQQITVTEDGLRRTTYWSLDPSRNLVLGSDDEYIEAFQQHFHEAVCCRIPREGTVGSTLSGGLDSSAIVAVLRDQLHQESRGDLRTFSAIFEKTPEFDESRFSRAVIERGGITGHLLKADRHSPLVDLDRMLDVFQEPIHFPNYFVPWTVCEAASKGGTATVFDGTDGDMVVSHGIDRLRVLARRGDWSGFADSVEQVSNRFADPTYASPVGITIAHGLPELRRQARCGRWISFARGIQTLHRRFGLSRKMMVSGRLTLSWKVDPAADALVFLAPDFARRTSAADRISEFHAAHADIGSSPRGVHLRDLSTGALSLGLEQLTRIGAAHGVDYQFPFCDRRLVEFCLSLPPDLKLRDGWNRWILRKAVTSALPESVCWRGGKTALRATENRGLLEFERGRLDAFFANADGAIWEYVDRDQARSNYQAFVAGDPSASFGWVWSTFVTARWLERTGLAP